MLLGGTPPDQFAAVFQLPLTLPSHDEVCAAVGSGQHAINAIARTAPNPFAMSMTEPPIIPLGGRILAVFGAIWRGKFAKLRLAVRSLSPRVNPGVRPAGKVRRPRPTCAPIKEVA